MKVWFRPLHLNTSRRFELRDAMRSQPDLFGDPVEMGTVSALLSLESKLLPRLRFPSSLHHYEPLGRPVIFPRKRRSFFLSAADIGARVVDELPRLGTMDGQEYRGKCHFPLPPRSQALRLTETDDRHEENDGDLFARCSSVATC